MATSDTIALLIEQIDSTEAVIDTLVDEVDSLDASRLTCITQLREERNELTKLNTALNALGGRPAKEGFVSKALKRSA